ncbi:MAG TPA: DUF4385 family protein [Candidatus Thermoplasmatota archaeon]|nr:DUF4385 family protein [Candidatus Thermoplasmatota archaeon]
MPSARVRAAARAYRIGRGEEGVLSTHPYTAALLPLWRFRTPALARASARALLARYRSYRRAGDFPGMDMCRKFLQMGYTRSRRYARHRSGRKQAADGTPLPLAPDPTKQESALVFKSAWDKVRADPAYQRRKAEHMARQHAARGPASFRPTLPKRKGRLPKPTRTRLPAPCPALQHEPPGPWRPTSLAGEDIQDLGRRDA